MSGKIIPGFKITKKIIRKPDGNLAFDMRECAEHYQIQYPSKEMLKCTIGIHLSIGGRGRIEESFMIFSISWMTISPKDE